MCHCNFLNISPAFSGQVNFIYLFVFSLIKYDWEKNANLVNKFTDEHFSWQKFYFLNKNENKWEK